jgi:iron complex outermembrane receptor protein
MAGILLAANSASVHAQDEFNLTLEELMQVKVVSSTLRDESLKTVPSAVTVFTREQLNQLGFDYLYELLGLVPGYQFNRNADSPAGYTFSARGRRNSSEAREVLLLVDGRVFSDPRTGGADGSLPLFPLSEIERVEIIRGPGSAIYGSNAFTGVINVVTRTRRNNFEVTAGSQNRRSAQMLFSQDNEFWQTNLFAQLYEDKGQVYSSDTSIGPDSRRAINIDFNVGTDVTKIRAAYHRLDTDNFYIAENSRDGFNDYVQLFKQFSVEHDFHFNENIKTHIALGYVDIEQELNFMVLPETYLENFSQPSSADALLIKVILAGETYRFTLANDWTINSDASVQFGVDLHSNRETDASAKNNFDLGMLAHGNFPITYYGDFLHSTQVGNKKSQDAAGLYTQYLQALSDSTNLTLGARYDYYEEIGKYISPRFGLVHQLNSNQTLKLLYGAAYRAPSLSETGFINNPVLVGNRDLDYETVKTWDLLWMGNWQKTSVSIGGFRNDYTHPIATGFLGPVRTYINGADEYSDGIESEASQQLTENWLVRATYTHFLSLPQSAFREAQQLASLVLNYEANNWGWNLSAIYQGQHNVLLPNNEQRTLESFWYANSKFRYRINSNCNLNLAAKNIFNTAYETPGQGTGLPEGTPNRGREWSLGIDWKY